MRAELAKIRNWNREQQAQHIAELEQQRDELLAALDVMVGRFDRFEVPFTLAELRRQIAAIANVKPEKMGQPFASQYPYPKEHFK